jgi:YHS domain-containing protein
MQDDKTSFAPFSNPGLSLFWRNTMSLDPKIVSTLRRGFACAVFAAAAAIVPLMAGVTSAHAYDITSKAEVNVTSSRIALQSHDPVAYQTEGKPVLGNERFVAEWEGAIYRFASEANLKLFQASPVKYAPLHGGFCQQGVAGGRKLDGDPALFNVADGRLAVFSYPAALAAFKRDPAGNAAKANENWTKVKDKTPRELFGL